MQMSIIRRTFVRLSGSWRGRNTRYTALTSIFRSSLCVMRVTCGSLGIFLVGSGADLGNPATAIELETEHEALPSSLTLPLNDVPLGV
jgi:hypothetical protein